MRITLLFLPMLVVQAMFGQPNILRGILGGESGTEEKIVEEYTEEQSNEAVKFKNDLMGIWNNIRVKVTPSG